MARGTTWNEAFVAVTGEDTSADVFARCHATDWIDLPAMARRAELVDKMAAAYILQGAIDALTMGGTGA